MKRLFLPIRAAGALLGLLPALLSAQTASPVQSASRAFGLDVVAPVELAGSDARSAAFQGQALPSITRLVNSKLSETLSLQNVQALQLDPTKLQLSTAASARVYFVGEGAGYHNTLGFNAIPSGQALPTGGLDASAKLIFPDASSSVSTYRGNSRAQRTSVAPLLPGDFVDLGRFSAGTTLDFFLAANGAQGGRNVYTAEAARNPDRQAHVVSFAVKDSPFLILAFEDLFGGGDRDFNDLVMAVDIGYENVQRLVAAPEPGTALVLASFLALAATVRYRRVQPGLAV